MKQKEKPISWFNKITIILTLICVGFISFYTGRYLYNGIKQFVIGRFLRARTAIGAGEDDLSGHYFTSVLAMKRLAHLEQQIIRNMVDVYEPLSRNWTDFKLKRRTKWGSGILKMRRYLEDYDKSIRPMLFKMEINPRLHFTWPVIFNTSEELEALQDTVTAHPLISFRLIRRVLKDLPKLLKSRLPESEMHRINLAYKKIEPKVSDEDLIGAAEGILRIQDTFEISVPDLVVGNLMDFKTNSGLKAVDVSFIGIIAIKELKWRQAVEWLHQALYMVKNQRDFTASEKFVRKDLLWAIDEHNKLWEKIDAASTIQSTFVDKVDKNLKLEKLPNRRPLGERRLFNTNDTQATYAQNFDALCRGEVLRSPNLTKNLKCWYEKGNPHLVIKPLKAELHNENPRIMQYYEWLPDSVIKEFKKVAESRLKRAKVLGNEASIVTSKVRISCNAFLNESIHTGLKKVPQIITEATGFNFQPRLAAEPSQISVYGSIGGYYSYHYDNLFDSRYHSYAILNPLHIFQEDRIATVMFYLSDVKKGGGTAFPIVGVVSEAVKGSAIFWFNVLKSGKRDDNTLHGGCPVLFGEKWVVNKWIRGGAQMFTRPCSTNPDE